MLHVPLAAVFLPLDDLSLVFQLNHIQQHTYVGYPLEVPVHSIIAASNYDLLFNASAPVPVTTRFLPYYQPAPSNLTIPPLPETCSGELLFLNAELQYLSRGYIGFFCVSARRVLFSTFRPSSNYSSSFSISMHFLSPHCAFLLPQHGLAIIHFSFQTNHFLSMYSLDASSTELLFLGTLPSPHPLRSHNPLYVSPLANYAFLIAHNSRRFYVDLIYLSPCCSTLQQWETSYCVDPRTPSS